jgi:hypothetical protein
MTVATEAKKAPGGSIVKDPELNAMNRIKNLLDALTPEVRSRVLKWVNDREPKESTDAGS